MKKIKVFIKNSWLTLLITLAFIALKLFSVISWAWIWVVSPIWIVLLLGFIFTIVELSLKEK